jgi:hypothetical protein
LYFFGSKPNKNFPLYLEGLEWISSLSGKDICKLFTNIGEFDDPQGFIPKGQDLNKRYSLIFSGCSESTGEYLTDAPDSYDGSDVWGFIASKKIKKPGLNLSQGGASAYEISRTLLKYIRANGNPDFLLCLYPDLNRLNIPNDPSVLVDSQYIKNKKLYNQVSTVLQHPNNSPTYSKKPHRKEDVIPKIVPIWLNIQSILFLEQYCSANSIKFLYSSWSPQTTDILSSINTISMKEYEQKSFPGFLDSDPDGWAYLQNDSKCFDPSHNLDTEVSKKYFTLGKDGLHMGKHRNLHIADFFIKALNLNNPSIDG